MTRPGPNYRDVPLQAAIERLHDSLTDYDGARTALAEYDGAVRPAVIAVLNARVLDCARQVDAIAFSPIPGDRTNAQDYDSAGDEHAAGRL